MLEKTRSRPLRIMKTQSGAKESMILDKIIAGSKDDFDMLYRLLYARGFLVERQGNDIVLSDNAEGFNGSHESGKIKWRPDSDWNYLIYIIENLFNVEGYRIVSCTDRFSAEHAYSFLFQTNRMWGEQLYGTMDRSFDFFKTSVFPKKIPVHALEPFVAMYVKALSSIKINSLMSCNGHEYDVYGKSNALWIVLGGICHSAFHAALWEIDEGLKQFKLPWKCGPINWTRGNASILIDYDRETITDVFADVIHAGQYIYENRMRFRVLRECVGYEIRECDTNLNFDALTQKMIDIISERKNR